MKRQERTPQAAYEFYRERGYSCEKIRQIAIGRGDEALKRFVVERALGESKTAEAQCALNFS